MKMNQDEEKSSFICRCGLCKRETIALSQISLNCGYGSQYDFEGVHLNLCGDCADAFYVLLGGSADSTNK